MKAKSPVCEVYCFDEAKVNRLQPLVTTPIIVKVAQLFKVLADDTRIKIAYALCQENEMCVCDVANVVGSTVATASHHLRLLKNLGLAKYRKEGKLVFYSLDDDHVKDLIMLAMSHVEEAKENAGNID